MEQHWFIYRTARTFPSSWVGFFVFFLNPWGFFFPLGFIVPFAFADWFLVQGEQLRDSWILPGERTRERCQVCWANIFLLFALLAHTLDSASSNHPQKSGVCDSLWQLSAASTLSPWGLWSGAGSPGSAESLLSSRGCYKRPLFEPVPAPSSAVVREKAKICRVFAHAVWILERLTAPRILWDVRSDLIVSKFLNHRWVFLSKQFFVW